MKCPNCGNTLTDNEHCEWCGWPKNRTSGSHNIVTQHAESTGNAKIIQVGGDVNINTQKYETMKQPSIDRRSGKQQGFSQQDQSSQQAKTTDIKVFLSYAREDSELAEKIFLGLEQRELKIWKDDKILRVGDIFDAKIRQAIQDSDFAIVLLSSKSVSKIGYVQNEFRQILEASKYRPSAIPFLLPIKLDNCKVPFEFSHINWIEFGSDEEAFLDRLNDDIKTHFQILSQVKN